MNNCFSVTKKIDTEEAIIKFVLTLTPKPYSLTPSNFSIKAYSKATSRSDLNLPDAPP